MRRHNEVVVLANDVVPGMGLPVAAPGLRAWGLANGLRAHGYQVTLVVDERIVSKVWTRRHPAPQPKGSIVLSPKQVGQLVRRRQPRALVVTNSNHVDEIGDVGRTKLVYDFFAPKVLEFEQNADLSERRQELQRLVDRKLRALSRSDAVIVNGTKKMDYVRRWLERSGSAKTPTAVVVMPVPARQPKRESTPGPLHAVVSGYLQPWSRPGQWAEAITPFLQRGSLVLHLLVTNHWGGEGARHALPEAMEALGSMDNVHTHGMMEFEDFHTFLSGCDLSLDLFEHNAERELAMVTRTMVAVAGGLPTIHVPFTETAELVRHYDAGWLVPPDDVAAITAALEEAVGSPEMLATKRAGAARMAAALDPPEAVRPLVQLLEGSLR